IKSIYDHEYTECERIRRMCSEEQWDRLAKFSGLDSDELPEVILMNKALAKLRKTISAKDRPLFFKREAQRVEAKKIKSR
ncbi:MAG: hypothetical protein KAS32_26390, partial [Candidatus Peribacteraceae bacterium]|nr:hypothetical protein [Candidatus Peribacteraceae bacterium]